MVAAGRGLPIPAADEIPEEEPAAPLSSESPHASDPNLPNLMVPMGSRSQTVASDRSATLSVPPATSPEPASPSSSTPAVQSASPFRPRTRILASLTTSAKNPSPVDIVPREIQLPKDPYVKGQHIEAFLYKDATECPICFLYYPPYLNKTRCCDQPICSECFVQIKRPDPHPPEHETNDPSQPGSSNPESSAEAEALVSEPACCPYCQLPEFGVTYEPPPFRRGLSYANPQGLETPPVLSPSSPTGATGTTTSLAPHTHKRRTTSISASAPTVIATDRIRPDWAVKLANARSHMARRSAAATALHTAAYLMGNGSTDNRGFGFGSRSRFGRSRGENSPVPSGSATPSAETGARTVAEQIAQMRREAQEPGGSRRRGRMDDLEEMMMIEAIKLSLEAEEERKRKVEKEAAKDAKKRAKEEKKREKRERKGVYGSGASSARGSALSLSGFGRRRGNSGGSNLAREITPESVDDSLSKGKEADRGIEGGTATLVHINTAHAGSNASQLDMLSSRNLDGGSFPSLQEFQDSPTTAAPPDRPSHLRQISNASSLTSSFVESAPNSPRDDAPASWPLSSSPNASGINVPGNSNNPHDTSDASSTTGFNLQSLTAVINNGNEDKAPTVTHAEEANQENKEKSTEFTSQGLKPGWEESVMNLTGDNSTSRERQTGTPRLIVTPGTPAASNEAEEFGKQLGTGMSGSTESVITQ